MYELHLRHTLISYTNILGNLAGKSMKKLSGWLPSWAVSEEQKQSLAKMVGQAQGQKMPGAEELEKLKSEGGGGKADQGWMESAKCLMPSQQEVGDAAKKGAEATGENQPDQASSGESKQRKKPRKLDKPSGSKAASTDGGHNEPVGNQSSASPADQDHDRRSKNLDEREAELDRKQADLEEWEKTLAQREQELGSKSENGTPGQTQAPKTKRQPRKIQSRS